MEKVKKVKSKSGTKKFIIGGIILLFVAGASYGAYYLVQRKKKTGSYMGGGTSGSSTSRSSGSTKTRTSTTRTSTAVQYTNKSYPLRQGTYHPDVAVLQRYLKATYNANLGSYGKNRDGVDGHFGNVTKAAALKHLKKQVFTEKDIAGMKAALKIIKV